MSMNYKGANEELSTNNLDHAQRHILTAVYKNKIREIVNAAINTGDDISVDEDGNLLCVQTRFCICKYEWCNRIQDFVKVRSKSRRKKKGEEVLEEIELYEAQEEIKELVEEEE